jgi:mono/diheme cytochrome c family protein
MKTNAAFAMTGLAAFLLMSFAVTKKFNDPWPVPDKFVKMANPVAPSAASTATGKDIYMQQCKSCHGPKGKGDGPKASQLDTECGDFTSAAFQKQTDGSLFYKTSEGRKDMPSYKKKITNPDDIWAVVNFVRTLK